MCIQDRLSINEMVEVFALLRKGDVEDCYDESLIDPVVRQEAPQETDDLPRLPSAFRSPCMQKTNTVIG